MMGLTYYYYKTVVVIIRFFTRVLGIVVGRPAPTPDEVLQIPSRNSGRTIKAHVYHSSTTTTGPKPVLLNFHGSGFMLPQHGEDDEYCRRISQATKYTVVDCSYRLAPENPFPAALNDVEDAVKYILNQPSVYDPTNFSIGGFSAGGNLSLAASACLFPPETFRSLIAFYPALDLKQFCQGQNSSQPKRATHSSPFSSPI
ncbi:esterase/lipase [Penicillium hetheringtonii]|uniref:Esterase/lipase n=1 Tax=Penicillium hetheringtonii TaxID=911720 RepID=A0AAD6DBC3_9EURO|nr:esterase/lipase [Penicillium hetheringtonii]